MNIPFPALNWASIVLKLALAAVAFGAGFFTCYHFIYTPSHDACIKTQTQVADAGKTQNAATAATNKTNTEATNEAQKKRESDIQANADWYKFHPSDWVQHNNAPCSRKLPSTAHHSKKPEPISAKGNEQPQQPKFTPEQCTFYADELTRLLDLLHTSPTVQFEK